MRALTLRVLIVLSVLILMLSVRHSWSFTGIDSGIGMEKRTTWSFTTRDVTCARIDQMVPTALERGGIALPQRVRTILTPTANAADPVSPAALPSPLVSGCASPPA
ncbi:hypothetical protein ACIBK9_11890 [Nonomuraea sp. NPDC050227]|uniref:hypothetical protein n=1 Tax=Nonomuraea sp. NPDC050227 TaxID=3364360 RepID=UPI0037A46ACB